MNLENINGLEKKSINLLKKLNIYTINDLVLYYPYRYEIIKLRTLDECIKDTGNINVQIIDNPTITYYKKSLNRMNFRVLCEGKIISVVIFNRAYLKNKLKPSLYISIKGKFNKIKNVFTASDISLKLVDKTSIEPIYHKVDGITDKQLNQLINELLKQNIKIDDYVPDYYNNKYNLLDKLNAIKQINNPTSLEQLKKAKIKLIYEEFFVFMFKMNYMKAIREKENNGIKRDVSIDLVNTFIESLPFKLTEDQLRTVNDIYKDLCSNKRMNRLILGDVGSGKTIVAVIAMVINSFSNYQSCLMAPTEVLAQQHFETIKSLVPNLQVGLLVGSMKAKEKKEVLKGLEKGSISILIGTHAMLSDNVIFNNLGLVITDEQHRFGVNQRKTIQDKGMKPDVIYLSATPIPRTYALSLYGDMDLSTIKSKPNGRRNIITKVVSEDNIRYVLEECYKQLKENHQIYVVSPLIDDSENEVNDIYKLKSNFDKAFSSRYKIDILHGKMKKEEKNKVMESFKRGETKILISTTVIEVGVDVKNSTVMVIYNAERFGLATLHQLRGRVGRNDLQSYCYLICNDSIERLKVLEESNDGFYISEKDFQMRGQGDLFGVMQSGDMHFKIGDIRRDTKILMQCKEDAYNYVNNFDNNLLYKDLIDKMNFNN